MNLSESFYIESIYWRKGVMPILSFHQKRFEQTQLAAFGSLCFPNLKEMVPEQPDIQNGHQVYKCRIVYNRDKFRVTFSPYKPHHVREFQLVNGDEIDYHLKFENRLAFNRLKMGMREDEEALIIKNGLITDTTYTNVAFFDGYEWWTPDTPLLLGTRRSYLLENGIIKSVRIAVGDLSEFKKIRLINAMMEWEECPELPINSISGLIP